MTTNFSEFKFKPGNGKRLRTYLWEAGRGKTAKISNAGGETLATTELLYAYLPRYDHWATSVKIEPKGMREFDEVVIALVYMHGKYASWIGRP